MSWTELLIALEDGTTEELDGSWIVSLLERGVEVANVDIVVTSDDDRGNVACVVIKIVSDDNVDDCKVISESAEAIDDWGVATMEDVPSKEDIDWGVPEIVVYLEVAVETTSITDIEVDIWGVSSDDDDSICVVVDTVSVVVLGNTDTCDDEDSILVVDDKEETDRSSTDDDESDAK